MENRSIENEERQTSGIVRPLSWILAGAAVGGLCAFFLDPQQGRRRRALVMDKANKLKHRTEFYGGKIYRDLRNRTKGVIHEASRQFQERAGQISANEPDKLERSEGAPPVH